MVAAPTQPPARPPGLTEATTKATAVWQDDLQQLFHRAKDRFPDVVWDLVDEDALDVESEEVWGHKAVVYARAPPSFQARYFTFRPPPVASPLPFGTSPTPSLPNPSALSLNLGPDYNYAASIRSVSPSQLQSSSPHGRTSPTPSVIGMLTRIPLTHNPPLFSNELEYLYTGKGIGAAFEFLFDANEKGREDVNDEESRIDKLRKDLVFMWRSRLFSDARLQLVGNFSTTSSSSDEETSAVFSSHRFILAARSPYFYDQLITYGLKNLPEPGEAVTLTLPSPPFTPPALHFALGFLYSGTLGFSNRTYDLDTAFALLSSSNYLQLQSLYDEVQARLVQEMLHGLFHAFLDFSEYERITGGRWGTGGCRCRQCARRAPRTLMFAVRDDVQNVYLDRGARRALVGLFGEGWCTSEFASLPQKTKDGLMTGLAKRTIPLNVFLLLFAAHAALKRLNSIRDSWSDGVKEMVISARSVIDKVLCNEAEKCFSEHDWIDILENDGLGRFEDGERVEWVMDAIKRGISEPNAGVLYQTLVSAILLRPHPTEPNQSQLSSTSQIRVLVEQTRMDILRWLRRRWVGVRQEGGFDMLESWALKEISHEIDVPAEDLLTPTNTAPSRGPMTRAGLRPVLSKVEDVASERDSTSLAPSLRASVLNKNMARTNATPSSSAAPAYTPRGTARSVVSSTSRVSSRLSASTTGTERERKESRPDSKLSPVTTTPMDVDSEGDGQETPGGDAASLMASLASEVASVASSRRTAKSKKDTSDAASIASVHQVQVTNVQRPKSIAPSVASTRSRASTIRRNAAASGAGNTSANSTLRPPKPPSRATSAASAVAKPGKGSTASPAGPSRDSVARSRKISTASTASNLSVRSTASRSPLPPAPPLTASRSRRLSEASVTSASTTAARRIRKVSTQSMSNANGDGKTLSVRKTPSTTSMRSTASRSPTNNRSTAKRPATADDRKPGRLSPKDKPLPKRPSKESMKTSDIANTASNMTVKGKARADVIAAEGKSNRTSSDRGSRSTIRRKGSSDTITLSRQPRGKAGSGKSRSDAATEAALPGIVPRGATLDIGIPCIISSKRKRFRAFARYIGEVEGERGPWVGVEVPVNDSWAEELNGDKNSDGRQWHDGSWGGVRYFEVGSALASEWGDDERLNVPGMLGSRRRRGYDGTGLSTSASYMTLHKGTTRKREGDQLSVERGPGKRFRSASPSVSDMSTAEYRGLFVRPQQVLYVVDAVGSDL